MEVVRKCKSGRIFTYQIDEEDKCLCRGEYLASTGYVKCYLKGAPKSSGFMHRIIMNAPKGVQVDHINGDKTDNRKANLRLCCQLENNRNTGLRSNNKSGKCGVYWDKKKLKWIAQIKVDNKIKHLGEYYKFEVASSVRDAAEIANWGEFRPRNGK